VRPSRAAALRNGLALNEPEHRAQASLPHRLFLAVPARQRSSKVWQSLNWRHHQHGPPRYAGGFLVSPVSGHEQHQAVAVRSEKSGAKVEAVANHTQGGEQADAAKDQDRPERTSIRPRVGGLAHKNVCNNRIHDNLLIRVGCQPDIGGLFQNAFAGR
jgi:hypothetical protein